MPFKQNLVHAHTQTKTHACMSIYAQRVDSFFPSLFRGIPFFLYLKIQASLARNHVSLLYATHS